MIDTPSLDAFLARCLRALESPQMPEWPGPADKAWNMPETHKALWGRIDYHGIAVLLHQHNARIADWPQKLRDRIAEEARLMALWEATHRSALASLIEALADAGIATVVMKGTALAYSIYEEPSARRRGDTDLLIHPGDIDRTRTQLMQGGWYRNNDPHGLYFQEGWLHDAAGFFVHALDLHWEPSDRPALQRVLDADQFFTHKRPLPRISDYAFGADPALALIHGAINQTWHHVHGYWAEDGRIKGSRRLIWSVDFDRLVATMSDCDWDRLILFGQEKQIGELVAEVLMATRRDLGTHLPEDRLNELASQTLHPDIQLYFESADSLTEFWLDLRTARSWRDRYRMIAERGFPPREHLEEKYPAHRKWPTALLQLRLLLETAGRVIRRGFTG